MKGLMVHVNRLSLIKDAVEARRGTDLVPVTPITSSSGHAEDLTPKLTFDGYALRVIRRFMAKLLIDPSTGCWNWRGHVRRRDGYSRFSFLGKSAAAYRVAYFLFRSDIPEFCDLDHLCRNRQCVNPWHLEAVDHATNIQRSPLAGLHMRLKTHCANGHEFNKETTKISSMGYRFCAICVRESSRRRAATPEALRKKRERRAKRKSLGLPAN